MPLFVRVISHGNVFCGSAWNASFISLTNALTLMPSGTARKKSRAQQRARVSEGLRAAGVARRARRDVAVVERRRGDHLHGYQAKREEKTDEGTV